MKSIRAVAGLVLLFFCLLLPAGSEAAPQILIEEQSFNFGELKEGAVVAHTFLAVNKGSEVLEILQIKPS
jgi:hypothetical protein